MGSSFWRSFEDAAAGTLVGKYKADTAAKSRRARLENDYELELEMKQKQIKLENERTLKNIKAIGANAVPKIGKSGYVTYDAETQHQTEQRQFKESKAIVERRAEAIKLDKDIKSYTKYGISSDELDSRYKDGRKSAEGILDFEAFHDYLPADTSFKVAYGKYNEWLDARGKAAIKGKRPVANTPKNYSQQERASLLQGSDAGELSRFNRLDANAQNTILRKIAASKLGNPAASSTVGY